MSRLAKIRLLALIPLGFGFLFFGSIFLSLTSDNANSSNTSEFSQKNFITTQIEDFLAQAPSSTPVPEPPRPTAIPTDVPEPPRPTAVPTDTPNFSCSSRVAYTGSGQNLVYVLDVSVINGNSQTNTEIDVRNLVNNSTISIEEFSGNCRQSAPGFISCNRTDRSNAIMFFKVNPDYNGKIDLNVKSHKEHIDSTIESSTCNASIDIVGINTPPPGLPVYTPQPGGNPETPFNDTCQPFAEYCEDPGENLLDDVLFNQSHDGSFENPLCTLHEGIPDPNGKGCAAVGFQATHYQADVSANIPINSQAFFVDTGAYQRPEYIRMEVAGPQQCQEKLTAHGNNSLKMFSRQGKGLDGGLCLPMKATGTSTHAGINFRISQSTSSVDQNVPVVMSLGYITTDPKTDFYLGSQPALGNGSGITWVASDEITVEDYGKGAESLYAERYAGGFLSGVFPPNAKGLCFKAKSQEGNGIDTFWDAAFVANDANACENALDHSDGIDRSCGGYACEGSEPQMSGNFYTDFDQEYYAYDMPDHWNAQQCHYETETNGGDSPLGTLYAGLDINSCDPNYSISTQRNLHPNFRCTDDRNWTFGFAWTGGVKDFALLQYLDCAVSNISGNVSEGGALKGTDSNPFYCDRLIDSYNNSNSAPAVGGDPDFFIRYQNTYSGLAIGMRGEAGDTFFKVPILGSAIASGILNNWQREKLTIDPFLIQNRNSGDGLNNELKFNLEDTVIAQFLRKEEHLYSEISTIKKNEVLAIDVLAKGPVCTDIYGDPISKFHYGTEGNSSDRAVFGFADDLGSFEHLIEEDNLEMTPEQVCDSQFISPQPYGEVVGAECTINNIGHGESATFNEDNMGNTLEQEGIMSRIYLPTLPPPAEPGSTDPAIDTCPEVTFCGQSFNCGSTMRELYNACRGTRPDTNISEISGNPFIRWERPDGWESLKIAGLNKVLEATWENEFTQYNQPLRHENVGIDVNQVVSLYDQQQPDCSIMPADRRPAYCTDSPMINEAAQVCRRVDPYNCKCNSRNLATCLIECKVNFQAPPRLPSIGLQIEGGPEDSIRGILENDTHTFLERFIALLDEKTSPGQGAKDYNSGEVYSYEEGYKGGFLLANTSNINEQQCSSDNKDDPKASVSQVRIENYYAYAGQIPRMNERLGFAATNSKDPKTLDQLTVDLETATIASLGDFFERGGEAYEDIAVPYCDLLTEKQKDACSTGTAATCDCLIRSCEQQKQDKIKVLRNYVDDMCDMIMDDLPDNPEYAWIFRGKGCVPNLMEGYQNRFNESYDTCVDTPKTNLNFNCDPMASYLISQGFDTPQLRLAACEDIENLDMCRYEKFGVHLITGPTQTSNYDRAEEIGLQWKMEVITEDTPDMINAMVQSIDSFNGKSVFRFCNADHGDSGSKIQDQSCQFRTELTHSTEASAKKVAQMVMAVARKSSKKFYVSPINEPISEHWYGGDPNDVNHEEPFDTTMPAVSEFYTHFVNELNSDPSVRGRVEIGSPTFNVTAFNSFDNFTNMYQQFGPKELVDFWTVTMYNNNDLPADFRVMEAQFERVKQIIPSGQIALNESGDFQHNLDRLEDSYTALGKESRLKYALMFNAFGGLGGDARGEALILSDEEIKQVLSGNRKCSIINEGNVCIEEGVEGLIASAAHSINSSGYKISPEVIYGIGMNEGIIGGLTGNPNQTAQENPTLGNDKNGDGAIFPPCVGVNTPSGCEYDVRGILQIQNFTFYNITSTQYDLMKACTDGMGIDYSERPPDEGMQAYLESIGKSYSNYEFSRARVGDSLCAAAILLAEMSKNQNGGTYLGEAQWQSQAENFTVDDGTNIIYRTAGQYLGVTDYDTCTFVSTSGNRTPYQYCNKVAESTKSAYERGIFDNISGECDIPGSYAGTCQEIFEQVKAEEAYSNIPVINYSEEVIPTYSGTFAGLRVGNHFCSMTNYATDQTLYCFEKGEDGTNTFGEYCLSCPVRATALFRHELNHAISPIRGLGRTYSEFSADAVSNNGGWYMFKHQERWMFATQIVKSISEKRGIPVTTINNYLNGKIPDPGINIEAEVTDICHYSGGGTIRVQKCPNPQVPPGLEAANCQNVSGGGGSTTPPGATSIGTSEGGNSINLYEFGNGPNKILFVGGMHGGYEWNSILTAYDLIDYLTKNPSSIPTSATIQIIPSANPDGQKRAGLGTGKFAPGNYGRNIANRYNDNGVDLNRNFDCEWTPDIQGPGGTIVGGGGTSPFSESESRALRNFIQRERPRASVFWHSVGGFVSPAGCGQQLYTPSVNLSNTYGVYNVISQQDIDNGGPFAYSITGDITNWMEKIGLAGTTVELQSTNNSEFSRNIPGILRVIQQYGSGSGGHIPI